MTADQDIAARAEAVLAQRRARIDEALDRWLPNASVLPGTIHESMRYSVLAPGKRFRPALLLTCAEALEVPLEAAMPSACALELIHAFSLIHDDLPAMDDDDLRRGRPTNHKQFGEDIAILAGDALSALAFEIIGRHTPDKSLVADLIVALGEAVGTDGMIGGQVLDMEGEKQIPSLARVNAIHSRKTAALIKAAGVMAAILAKAPQATRAALALYGEHVGLAFQIMDDLLDALADPEFMGKQTGKDSERGKMTWPACVGIEESRDTVHRLVQEAIAAVRPIDRCGELELLAQFLFARVP